MAERTRIGLQVVRGLEAGATVWDSVVAGFHARRQRSDAVAYILFYRTAEGRQRFQTIGRHGAPWTPDTARDEARRILAEVAGGSDPAAAKKEKRHAKTVGDLCDLYLADAEAGRLLTRQRGAKKLSTLATDKGRIEGHIRPLLGRRKVAAVTREDVEAFMHAVSEGKTAKRAKTEKKRGVSNVRGGAGTASRTVGLLGAIFTYAVRRRMRADNPVRGVVRPADGRKERRLSDDEYKALGLALAMAAEGGIWPAAVAAVRFLALTGWRSGEALGLHWAEVDLARRTARLGDTKTGASMRPLPNAACDVLRGLSQAGGLAFPPTRGKKLMAGFPKLWARVAKLGDLPTDITPHVLRHSFATHVLQSSGDLRAVQELLGHASITATQVYTSLDFQHLARVYDQAHPRAKKRD